MKNILAGAAALLALTACSGLSDEAKQMVGDYYIPEVSAEEPLMELRGNGKCVMHAIRPGALTYRVPGRWNVEHDSLVMELRPADLEYEGDSTLIGSVPTTWRRRIVSFNGTSVTLSNAGVNYVYYRRGHI